MLCVGAAPLILTGPAPAEFVGFTIKSVPNPYGLQVTRVYAAFDCAGGDDEMLAVYGTPDVPLTLSSNFGFYQHPFGSDTAPNQALVEAFGILAFDTFVTIGVKSVGAGGQPVDETELMPGWPGLGTGDLTTTSSGWSVPSGSLQGDPFNQWASYTGEGLVLIGQFSSQDFSVHGTMMLKYRSNGVIEEREIAYAYQMPICLQIDDCLAHPCHFITECSSKGDFCKFPQPYPPINDCNSNGIGDGCDIACGRSLDKNANGVPDECDCPADCGDGDGMVGIDDFLALLSVWGQTGVPCDIDNGGVGITDFLALLAAWGPCP